MYQEILKESFRSNVIRAIFVSRSAVGLPEACEIYEKMDDAEEKKYSPIICSVAGTLRGKHVFNFNNRFRRHWTRSQTLLPALYGSNTRLIFWAVDLG